MQMVGPYRVVGNLGTCQIGRVLSAVDPAGVQVTLAVLEEPAAANARWRDAFSFTANALARGGMRALHGDFAASEPWVAVTGGPGPGAGQIFAALGQEVQPAAPEPADQPHPVQEQPVAGHFDPISEPTVPVQRVTARPVSPGLVSPVAASPGPISGGPISGGPISGGPISGGPISGGPTSPGLVSGGRSEPLPDMPDVSAPPRLRAGVWIGVIGLLILVPGVGGAILATMMRPVDQLPDTLPGAFRPSAAAPGSQVGVEPPRWGTWPTDWPKFKAGDRTKRLTGLDGLGFAFTVPANWECARVARGTGSIHYTCGVSGGLVIGGDLIVRDCPAPCNESRRIDMRRSEPAWSVRWIRADDVTVWSTTWAIDGAPRYGLVFIQYWRSTPEKPIDRQLVFRMSAPEEQADDLRRVANDIYNTLS